MARIWITRSDPAASLTARRLRDMGYDNVMAAPLLGITLLSPKIDIPHSAHLIFTSRNGVRSFAQTEKARHWPCLCVGDATAQDARRAGFKTVVSAGGDSGDVTMWALENIPPDQPVLHICGNHPRGEIIEHLRQNGFSLARREIYYLTEAVSQDPRPARNDDDIVLLYSPQAAKSLIALGLDMRAMTLICMSAAVDAALGGIPCKARFIAARPDEDSLFAHLTAL